MNSLTRLILASIGLILLFLAALAFPGADRGVNRADRLLSDRNRFLLTRYVSFQLLLSLHVLRESLIDDLFAFRLRLGVVLPQAATL